jgi:hypothetical protein
MRAQDKVRPTKNASSHETSPEMVIDLLNYVPYYYEDVVMDAGSGANKVWYNNIITRDKMEWDLEDGKDYLKFDGEVDWTVGNPPYHISWDFHLKALQTSRKGIAWLVNLNNLNSLLSPKRLNIMRDYEFELTHIIVVEDVRWFGRYFFLIFEKIDIYGGQMKFSWINKKYGNKLAKGM